VLHCCAVIAPNQDVAFMLSILWTTIQLLLSGFFVNFHEVRAVMSFGMAQRGRPRLHARLFECWGRVGLLWVGECAPTAQTPHPARPNPAPKPPRPRPNPATNPSRPPPPKQPPKVLLRWITAGRYLSATYFAFEALLVNEFRGAFLSCAQGLSPTEVNFLLGAFPNTPDAQRNQVGAGLGFGFGFWGAGGFRSGAGSCWGLQNNLPDKPNPKPKPAEANSNQPKTTAKQPKPAPT
jgi:hypothetical protein